MAPATPVDQAFDRYAVLSKLIELEMERGRANPKDGRYVALGITEIGDTKREAAHKIVETLDGLAKLTEHVAILDMAASLERLFRARIANVIGDARKTLAENARRERSRELAPKLVRSIEEFRGLRDIADLVEAVLSGKVIETLMLVSDSRNKFAHGTDLSIAPVVEPAQARENLNEIVSRL